MRLRVTREREKEKKRNRMWGGGEWTERQLSSTRRRGYSSSPNTRSHSHEPLKAAVRIWGNDVCPSIHSESSPNQHSVGGTGREPTARPGWTPLPQAQRRRRWWLQVPATPCLAEPYRLGRCIGVTLTCRGSWPVTAMASASQATWAATS